MSDFQLSRALSTTIGDALAGSHGYLNELFLSSGAPGPPPDLSHATKWQSWLLRMSRDPDVNTLEVLGRILEEVMDIVPVDEEAASSYIQRRSRVEEALEAEGLQYFRGGRVFPSGKAPTDLTPSGPKEQIAPSTIEELLTTIVRGLPRAMHPLEHRRKGAHSLTFRSEYDVQDLLHSLLRPWVSDIRPEEYTPSYAGSSTRMDFLLPKYATVIETKIARDLAHAKKIGQELTIDIAHYRAHPKCDHLWCVIYDPQNLVQNTGGLSSDIEGKHENALGTVHVKVVVV